MKPLRDENVKNKICKAARFCLEREGGLHRVSIATICKKAGIGQSQLYRLYGDREKLIESVMRRRVIEMKKEVNDALDDLDSNTLRDVLSNFIERLFFQRVNNREDVALDTEILAEAFCNQNSMMMVFEHNISEDLERMLERAKDRGLIRVTLDCQVASALIVGAIDSACRAHILKLGFDLEQAYEQLQLLTFRLLEIESPKQEVRKEVVKAKPFSRISPKR